MSKDDALSSLESCIVIYEQKANDFSEEKSYLTDTSNNIRLIKSEIYKKFVEELKTIQSRLLAK